MTIASEVGVEEGLDNFGLGIEELGRDALCRRSAATECAEEERGGGFSDDDGEGRRPTNELGGDAEAAFEEIDDVFGEIRLFEAETEVQLMAVRTAFRRDDASFGAVKSEK